MNFPASTVGIAEKRRCSYPTGNGGVSPLFQLWVSGKAVPHDVRCVIFVSELRAAFKHEVYDEELDSSVHT